jgi:hypothetical protein
MEDAVVGGAIVSASDDDDVSSSESSPESDDDFDLNSPLEAHRATRGSRRGVAGSSNPTRIRRGRPLPKDTGIPTFLYTPIAAAPANGQKQIDFFVEYLNTLLLEAPQPIPAEKICKIIAESWGVKSVKKATRVRTTFRIYGFPLTLLQNLISQALTRRKDTLWVRLRDGNRKVSGYRWWHMSK